MARLLSDMAEDVRDFVERDPPTAPARLGSLPGVGKGAVRRILEYVETGRLREHEQMLERVPVGLFDILRVPGLGPKAVKLLWQELEIESMADLRDLLDSGKIETLPRMGKKTVENLRKAIEFESKTSDRTPIGRAMPVAESIVARLQQIDGVHQVDFAGSLRRGRDTIGDIDILAAASDAEAVREAFVGQPEVIQVLARGETKCSVRLGLPGQSAQSVIQADLRIVPREAWGAALMYFTGSKEHNVRLREIAIRANRRLNEYGLYEGTSERPQDDGLEPVAAATEESIYRELALDSVPPELREHAQSLEQVPADLIELGNIGAELHSHTTASDGKLELEELADCARRRGLHTLGVTDHSQSSVIAGGLKPDELLRHIERIREANEGLTDLTLLAGAEVDILADGQWTTRTSCWRSSTW